MDTETDPENLATGGGTYAPHRAIRFMANTGKYAAKMGVKKGVSKAASKVNPTLLVVEAAISVVDCVKSFIDLAKAREIRDNLSRENDLLIEELATKREALEENIATAREKVEEHKKRKEVLADLVKECQDIFSESMTAFSRIRAQNLPELDQLARREQDLISSWESMKRALELYQSQI